MSKQLYISTRSGVHLHEPIGVCRVPTKDGICGKPFFPGEERAQANHAAACARENHEYLVAYMKQRHPDVMKPADEERARWVKQHGAAILEGRVKM